MKKTRAAILATVVSASLAGSAAGYAAHRASGPTPPSVASTAVGEGSPASSATAPGTTDPTTPSTPPTTTAEPLTPSTSAGATTQPASPTAARPAPTHNQTAGPSTSTPRPSSFGVGNLLVANDYMDAGISPVRIGTAAEGEGQAAISMCQDRSPSQFEGLRKVFEGAAHGEMDATQYAMLFRTATDARRAVGYVDEWRAWCPGKEISAVPFTSQGSSAHQVRLDGEGEGQWWTLRTVQHAKEGTYTRTELVAVVRIGDRMSVADVMVPNGAALPDGETLVRRVAARLA